MSDAARRVAGKRGGPTKVGIDRVNPFEAALRDPRGLVAVAPLDMVLRMAAHRPLVDNGLDRLEVCRAGRCRHLLPQQVATRIDARVENATGLARNTREHE